MRRGDIVSERFEVEELVALGGMGAVFRARDRESGAFVAIKVLTHPEADNLRFVEEARLLRRLSHPAVVRYLSDGTTDRGEKYLAMEWLEGEDLGQRLARAGLSVDDALTLTKTVAAALSAAHGLGVVHRDIKPSNLWLVGGEPSRVKLLDFGVAKQARDARGATKTGSVIGTAGYAAPEQIRADRNVDLRADIFALGCVLFECLTGTPPFDGPHLVAILAKTLAIESPNLRAIRPDAPAELDRVVTRMLAKEPDARYPDCATLARELDAIGATGLGPPRKSVPRALTGGAQRLMTVLAVELAPAPSATAETLDSADVGRAAALLCDEIALVGGRLASVSGASYVVAFGGVGGVIDQASSAASAALALRRRNAALRLALITGRVIEQGAPATGPTLERARALLADARPGAIVVDELSGRLLARAFALRQDGAVATLVGRASAVAAIPLPAPPTPFVGRERELGLLRATFHDAAAERCARAVVVTAAPGMGKTRLGRELVAALEGEPHGALWARADPIAGKTSLGLVAQLLQRRAGIVEGASDEARQQALRAWASEALAPDEARFALLCELAGLPPPEQAPGAALRAARSDPRVMHDRLAEVFQQVLAAEGARAPVLVVIDDVQWADPASLAFLGEALRTARAVPWLLLALARPGAQVPPAWFEAGADELRLAPLGRRAMDRIAYAASGGALDSATLDRLVDRADGNAFFLEELVAGARQGRLDPPETVLAAMEARMDALPEDARRTLRAASVYGETFWRSGVELLLGLPGGQGAATGVLAALCAERLVAPVADSRFAGEEEYAFRHSLMREAAYAALTAEDRARGHQLAALWLRGAGETDPLTLARHHQRAGELDQASPWLASAARRALDAGDPDTALGLTRESRPSGETHGLVLSARVWALSLKGDLEGVLAESDAALAALAPGEDPWLETLGWSVFAGLCTGRGERVRHALQALLTLPRTPEPSSALGQLGYLLSLALHNAGLAGAADDLARRLPRDHADRDADYGGFVALVEQLGRVSAGDLGGALARAGAAVAAFERSGNRHGQSSASSQRAWTLIDAGAFARAEAEAAHARALAHALGAPFAEGWPALWGAKAAVLAGDGARAEAELQALSASHVPALRDSAAVLLAEVLFARGQLDAAEAGASEVLAGSPLIAPRSLAHFVLARVALARGAPARAISLVDQADALFGGAPEARIEVTRLHALRVAALDALGRPADAGEARLALDRRIERIRATLPAELAAAYERAVRAR